eukprot:scaffold1553_cov132-Isochrysis_galbana.AAC.5
MKVIQVDRRLLVIDVHPCAGKEVDERPHNGGRMALPLDGRRAHPARARPCEVVHVEHVQIVHVDGALVVVCPRAAEDPDALADDRGGVPLPVVGDQ